MQDVIIEPERSLLIPGYFKVKEAALKAGALGYSLSGSGPSLFAFSIDKTNAEEIGNKMQEEFKKIGIESNIYVSKINQGEPKVI